MQPLPDEPIRRLWLEAVRAANSGQLGTVMSLPAAEVLPDRVYRARAEVLRLVWLPVDEFDAAVKDTAYFRIQARRHGEPAAVCRCRKFRRLAQLMRDDYAADAAHAPVVLIAPGGRVICRFDGTHRAAIARDLGYETILCVAITPDEYKAFQEPHLSAGPIRDWVELGMRNFPDWYQAIEVLPGMWTRPPVPKKTGPLVESLPDLTGRSVLEVGCNAGLYTFEAAARGASRAVGIDRRPIAIEQANWLSRVWSVARPETAPAWFVCGNIFDHLDLLTKADTVIAACVLYHMTGLSPDGTHRLDEFMRALANSPVHTVIVQGNRGRARKTTWMERARLNIEGVQADTPARLIFNLPQFNTLFARHGFKSVRKVPGTFPVAIYERNG